MIKTLNQEHESRAIYEQGQNQISHKLQTNNY